MAAAQTREDYLRERYSPDVADYLAGGEGFTTVDHHSPAKLADAWRAILEELAEAGVMRRSQSGRYWWATANCICGYAPDDVRLLAEHLIEQGRHGDPGQHGQAAF